MVAAVLKYADNILKCFGNALSIVLASDQLPTSSLIIRNQPIFSKLMPTQKSQAKVISCIMSAVLLQDVH